jgi:exonuclease III
MNLSKWKRVFRLFEFNFFFIFNRDGTSLVVINVYCPRVDKDKPERLTYKLNFYSALEQRARYFLQREWFVIVLFEI